MGKAITVTAPSGVTWTVQLLDNGKTWVATSPWQGPEYRGNSLAEILELIAIEIVQTEY